MASLVKQFGVPVRNESEMPEPANDHDLLIRLDSQLRMVREDLRSLTTRVDKAAGYEITADHERRLRILERYVWAAMGGLALLQIILKFGWPH